MAENVIKICMGSSCFSRGNKENLESIKNYIREHKLETSIILTGNLCNGSCNSGPNITFNEIEYNNVIPKEIDIVINKMFCEGEVVNS